ncbi:hypothetical protein MAR_037597, partial [Mya arenaria]
KPKELVLSGNFNCPDIDWNTFTVNCSNVRDKTIQHHLSTTNLQTMHSREKARLYKQAYKTGSWSRIRQYQNFKEWDQVKKIIQ